MVIGIVFHALLSGIKTHSYKSWRWQRHPGPRKLRAFIFCVLCVSFLQTTINLRWQAVVGIPWVDALNQRWRRLRYDAVAPRVASLHDQIGVIVYSCILVSSCMPCILASSCMPCILVSSCMSCILASSCMPCILVSSCMPCILVSSCMPT